MIERLKKMMVIAAFAAGLLGLSVTASFAGSSSECLPGCYCPPAGSAGSAPWAPGGYNPPAGPNGMMNHGGVLGLMENHSNALRLRDKATARQIGFQNDNGLGVTCYDHALALTSRLGNIFSDVAPAGAFPPSNSTVFKSAIFSPNYGSDQYLVNALNSVVVPQLQNHVNDFTDSLSDNLGATTANFFGPLMAAFNGLLAPITSVLGTFNSAISTINGFMNTLKTAQRALQFVTGIPGFYIFIQTLFAAINLAWTTIKNFITSTINAIQATIKGLVNALMSWLMGSATSMAAASGSGNGECDRIQQLWGNGFPASFMTAGAPNWERALTQTGRQGGTPYSSFGELLSMAPPGAGANLLQELSNGSNSTIINSAVADLGGGGALNQAGNMLSWPISPQVASPFTPASGAGGGAAASLPAAIIGAM